jgi:hypothetical protein
MRTLIFVAAATALVASSVQAAPKKAEARSEFTTRSPAGYVYRRTPLTESSTSAAQAPAPAAPAGDVAPAEVVVPGLPRAPSPVGQMPAATASRGAVSLGVGVNVAPPLSSTRGAAQQ